MTLTVLLPSLAAMLLAVVAVWALARLAHANRRRDGQIFDLLRAQGDLAKSVADLKKSFVGSVSSVQTVQMEEEIRAVGRRVKDADERLHRIEVRMPPGQLGTRLAEAEPLAALHRTVTALADRIAAAEAGAKSGAQEVLPRPGDTCPRCLAKFHVGQNVVRKPRMIGDPALYSHATEAECLAAVRMAREANRR